ncbi:MAG: hypothetical protein WCG27_11015, partial [Pseudomonadota bacterium]
LARWDLVSDTLNNWDQYQSLISSQSSHLILVQVQDVESFKQTTSSWECSYYVLADWPLIPQLEQEELKNLAQQRPQIMAFLDSNRGLDFHWPFLRSQIEKNNLLQKELDQLKGLGMELNKVVGQSLQEMHRVKKLHEQVVPTRRKKMKGLEVVCKYAAGERAGGDFFDFLPGEQDLLVLMTCTNSYVISSLILSHFELWREKKKFEDENLRLFLSIIQDELHRLDLNSGPNSKTLMAMIGRVEIKSMKFTGHILVGMRFFQDTAIIFLEITTQSIVIFLTRPISSFRCTEAKRL